MPDEIVAPAEQTLDQQLEALGKSISEPAKAQEPTPAAGDGKTPVPAASPELGVEPKKEGETPLEDPLEKALGEIDKETTVETPKEEKPKLSDEQQAILATIPNAQTAQRLHTLATGYENFSNAFEGGQFGDVDKMFTDWNPQAYEAYKEHIYQKNIGEWVDRWINENDPKNGGPQVNRQVSHLQKQIQDLNARLENRQTQEQGQQQQAQATQRLQQYQGHLTGLFDKIDFSAADRRWVLADINQRVYNNPQVRSAINAGNIAAVNSIFTAAVREYVNRDKQVTQGTQTALKTQEQKKAPVQGSNTAAEGALPEDIKQVPKGKEDEWMDQQFASLAKYIKKK